MRSLSRIMIRLKAMMTACKQCYESWGLTVPYGSDVLPMKLEDDTEHWL